MTCPLFCSSEKTQRQGKTRVDNFTQIATFLSPEPQVCALVHQNVEQSVIRF